MQIIDLNEKYLNVFFNLFSHVLNEDLREYNPDQIKFFLETMYPKDQFRKMISSGIYKMILAVENENVIGFLIADATFAGVGFITWLGVEREYRDHGIARQLVEYYEAFCRTQKAHLIEAYTFPKTLAFYEKLGFKKIGQRDKGYFGIVNIIVDKLLS